MVILGADVYGGKGSILPGSPPHDAMTALVTMSATRIQVQQAINGQLQTFTLRANQPGIALIYCVAGVILSRYTAPNLPVSGSI